MIAENLRLRNELDNSVRENRDDGADKAGSFCVKKRALFDLNWTELLIRLSARIHKKIGDPESDSVFLIQNDKRKEKIK